MPKAVRSAVAPTICVPKEHAEIELGVIVAMGLDRAIGQKGDMPWNVPADLVHFKETTTNSCVIMGRRTFESIGRPLPCRRNIVISRDLSLRERGVEVTTSLERALTLAADRQVALDEQKNLRFPTVEMSDIHICEYTNVFVIGGARLFSEAFAMPKLKKVFLTELRSTFPDADTFLPEFDVNQYDLVGTRPEQGYYLSRAEQPAHCRQCFPEGPFISQKWEEWRELPENPMAFRFLTYQKKA